MATSGIKFSDNRKWGTRSYLDYLEVNDIPFHYDGKELSFPNQRMEARAVEIWYALTGMRSIGVFAQ